MVGRGETLQAPGEPIEWIYFPLSGVISLLAELSDGRAAEAATAGPEGMVGLPVFLGARVSTTRNVAQTPGAAFALPSDAFRAELARHGAFERLIARYVELSFIAVAQAAVCARHHDVEQRAARAILGWMDRLEDDRVKVTHESLAEAIGARRASVSEAVAELARAGALQAKRGLLTIRDRRCLELRACECYGQLRAAFEQALA
jgi:CRP-like cAMP-binding protein